VCLLPFLQACTQKWPHIPVVLLLQPSTKRAINECLDNHSSFEIIDLGSEISKVGSILRGIVLKKNKLRVLPVLKRCKQTRSPLFQQALEHIVQGFQRIRSPSEVYDAINPPMAKEVFRRRFEQEVGISPKKLILELRLQYAAHLISTTSLAIKQIAGIVGFDDCYQFSKAFRFHTGDSPTGYRKGSSLNSRQAKG
jgi:YesN/AraC family two-component response regulator